MLTANKLIRQGRGLAPALVKRAAALQLDWDTRQKSRFDATDADGRGVGVFLPRGTVVRGGDVLVADDGSLLVVHAAPQPVLVVRTCAEHGTPADLARAAYHLGNRHVAVEVRADHLKIEPDHVLADMLRSQHLEVAEAQTAFEPEAGAYAGAGGHGGAPHDHAPARSHHHDHDQDHGHGHDHAHGDGHGHTHGHDPRHAHPAPPRGKAVPIAVAAAPHVHGPGCGHGGHGGDDPR